MSFSLRSFAAAFACAAALFAAPATAATYDATADFGVTSNPNGVWSYGYSTAGGSAYSMILFDQPDTGTILAWRDSTYISLGAPAAAKNTGFITLGGALPGQFVLHPGPAANGDIAILRFTAPATDTYNITGQFFAGDIGSMNGAIVLNGAEASPLQYFADTTDTSVFTPLSLLMAVGTTLDFVVGNNGSYFFGTTPLAVTITTATAVPEPASMALFAGGLVAMAGARRRSRGRGSR